MHFKIYMYEINVLMKICKVYKILKSQKVHFSLTVAAKIRDSISKPKINLHLPALVLLVDASSSCLSCTVRLTQTFCICITMNS